jgi:hypothetical protein
MPKKKLGRPRVEFLIRTAQIQSFDAHVSVRVERQKGALPTRSVGNWLLLKDVLDEPIKGQSDVTIRIVEDEGHDLGPNPAAIGHVLGMRPVVSV